jgi:uncharacterized protein YgiM (DUF1202 family)
MKTHGELPVIKFILGLAVFLLATLQAHLVTADYIRIKGTVVNVRQGPGTTYQVLFQAKQGDEFDLLKTEGLWCLISLGNDEEAWVFGRLVEIVPGERPSETNLQTGSEADQTQQPLWMKYLDKIPLMLVLLSALVLLLKRRQAADFARRKLKEISGYRREQPFRYDNRNPKDDSWEL